MLCNTTGGPHCSFYVCRCLRACEWHCPPTVMLEPEVMISSSKQMASAEFKYARNGHYSPSLLLQFVVLMAVNIAAVTHSRCDSMFSVPHAVQSPTQTATLPCDKCFSFIPCYKSSDRCQGQSTSFNRCRQRPSSNPILRG